MIDLDEMEPEVREAFIALQEENETNTQQMNDVQEGLQQILNNPKASEYLRNAVKEAGVEGVDIPENQITTQLKPMQAQLDKMGANQEQNRLWEVLKEKGLTADIEKIKKFQKDNGIVNDDSAIKLYEKTLPVAEVNRSVQYDNPFKKEGIEMDDNKIMDNIMAGLPNL